MDNKRKKIWQECKKFFVMCILVAIAIAFLIQMSRNWPGAQSVEEKSVACIITFGAQLKYVVSEVSPDIDLTNPAENTVYFIFEIVDSESGVLIGRTDKVAPGQRVCINVADFYPEPGSYYATLAVSTCDMETNIQKKGLKQGIEIEVMGQKGSCFT